MEKANCANFKSSTNVQLNQSVVSKILKILLTGTLRTSKVQTMSLKEEYNTKYLIIAKLLSPVVNLSKNNRDYNNMHKHKLNLYGFRLGVYDKNRQYAEMLSQENKRNYDEAQSQSTKTVISLKQQ